MGKREVSYVFKNKSHLGKVYLLDANNKKVVATGYGFFDTQKLKLLAQFEENQLSVYENILPVIETTEGYFSPLALRDFSSMGWGTQTLNQNMTHCLHWPQSKDITYVLSEFNEIRIAIDAISEKEELVQKTSGDKEAVLTKIAKLSNLGTAHMSHYSVEANSTYSWTSGNIDIRSDKYMNLSGFIAFVIKDTKGNNFSFFSLESLLFAFKAYWLLAHGHIDCNITHFKLDSDIDFIFDNSKLYALHDNAVDFRSIISVNEDLHLDKLLKCIYFVINPDDKKGLSLNSKVGLSLSSLARHTYSRQPDLLDNEVINLIFGLQSLSEAISENKISKLNKSSKTKVVTDIKTILNLIDSIKNELSDSAKDFYLKDELSIYRAISRPTFKQSVEISLDELDIDKSKHITTIAAINRARKQIVHHEGYKSQDIIGLLTTGKTDISRDKNGKIVSMTFGIKQGELDNLYGLLLEMLRSYFIKIR